MHIYIPVLVSNIPARKSGTLNDGVTVTGKTVPDDGGTGGQRSRETKIPRDNGVTR